jgi:hypothetical protein
MARRMALCAGALAIVTTLAVPVAVARTPLKPADMKTIRKDATMRARGYRTQYGAKHFTVTCVKTTPFSARCRIRLTHATKAVKPTCALTAVYVVVGNAIEGNLARNTCA